MIDRETATQVVVSGGAILLFVGAALYASSAYGENGHLSETGGYVLVGAIAAFVLITAVAGLWLSKKEFGDAEEG